MQTLEDAELLPVLETLMRRCRRAAEPARQVARADPGEEGEHDPPTATPSSLRQRLCSGAAVAIEERQTARDFSWCSAGVGGATRTWGTRLPAC